MNECGDQSNELTLLKLYSMSVCVSVCVCGRDNEIQFPLMV